MIRYQQVASTHIPLSRRPLIGDLKVVVQSESNRSYFPVEVRPDIDVELKLLSVLDALSGAGVCELIHRIV